MKKHLKRHDRENGNYDKVVNNGMKVSYMLEKFIALENKVLADLEEFNRKMEIGGKVKLLVDKHGFNENGLGNNMKEALKTYKLHGKIWI